MKIRKSQKTKNKKNTFPHIILSVFHTRVIQIKNYFFSKRFLLFLAVLGGSIMLCYFLLLFFASKIEMEMTFPGKDINLKEISNHPAGLTIAKNIEFQSASGEKIAGVYIDNNSEKVVYYFHGNGASIEYFYSDIQYIYDLGYSVIALEYPGYGLSTGTPTVDEISDFSETFYESMKQILGFEEKNMIIWGYSVGTAVAIEFAQDKDFDSLILFSPLASRYDMSSKLLGFPLQRLFFLPNSFISKETIKNIQEPTLIIHGNTDKVVPFEQGKLVYQNSGSEKKYFIEIDDFGHSLIPERYGEVLQGYIQNFISTYSLEKSETFLDRELATLLLKKVEEKKRIMSYDILSDTSLTKYVDPDVAFLEKGYVPQDMRRLARTYIIDTKGDAQMREEAADSFERMAKKFYEDMGEKMVVVSSYRSYSYQAGIKARGCPDNLCAKAGHSEHQSGLTADLWSASSVYDWNNSSRLTSFYTWLDENAHLYGFHNTYQNGIAIDGYDREPWHWRYLGVELATYLHEKDMTFAQYYIARMK